jgi:hypothetical protein
MSSGDPTDVTISMRVHGVEMKLGRLASGPTGQLEIVQPEELTVPDNITKPELMSSSETQGSTLRRLLTLTSSVGYYGK